MTFFEFGMPTAQPAQIQRAFVFLSSVLALSFTGLGIPLYHLVLFLNPLVVLAVLLTLAVIPPVSGLIEARKDPHIFARDRFVGHLLTNVLGAFAATAFVWVGHATAGFDQFTIEFKNEAAFNIVLPMTTIVILAFVRWQQLSAFSDLDEYVKKHDDSWKEKIQGYSLRHIHQFTNTVYLITVTFMGAGMILYLFAFTLEAAKSGEPLSLTWQLVFAIIALLAFLFACGLPQARKHQAVYLSFLTGTPAALIVSVVWLALLKESTARNILALSIIVVGYVLYTAEAVLGSCRDKDKIQMHYFSAAAFAVALTLLAGALYFSQPISH